MIEPPRRKANLRNELFRDLRTCCDMVSHQAYDNLRYHFLLGPSPSRFCYGLSTSSHRNGHLHGTSARHPDRTPELKFSHIEVREEYLRSETSWLHMELIPCG